MLKEQSEKIRRRADTEKPQYGCAKSNQLCARLLTCHEKSIE